MSCKPWNSRSVCQHCDGINRACKSPHFLPNSSWDVHAWCVCPPFTSLPRKRAPRRSPIVNSMSRKPRNSKIVCQHCNGITYVCKSPHALAELLRDMRAWCLHPLFSSHVENDGNMCSVLRFLVYLYKIMWSILFMCKCCVAYMCYIQSIFSSFIFGLLPFICVHVLIVICFLKHVPLFCTEKYWLWSISCIPVLKIACLHNSQHMHKYKCKTVKLCPHNTSSQCISNLLTW